MNARDSNTPEKVRESLVFFKNSFAGIVIGASSAVLSLAVPSALTKALSPTAFGVWAIVLQLAGYTGILGLGLQDAVGRYVAFHEERRDAVARDEFINAALWVLCFMAAIAAICIGLAAHFLDVLFPKIPAELMRAAQTSVLAAGLTMALALPASVFNGTLVALRHNVAVAAVVGTGRLVLTASLIFAGFRFQSLYWLAACFVVVNVVAYLVIWECCGRLTRVSLALRMPTWKILREIWSYCSATVIWQISALMISGLDVFIVGRLDFASVPYYTVCLVPITLLAGVLPALFSPLMQVGAKYAAREDDQGLVRILITSTRLATIAIATVATLMIAFDKELLTAWLGPTYAAKAAPILRLVVIGHALRQIAFPYATLLLATKKHNQLLFSPLAEGVTNLVVALFLGRMFGVLGVAMAVIAGSLVGQLLNYFYNLPRTHGSSVDRWALSSAAVFRPLLCFAPMALFYLVEELRISEVVSFAVRSGLFITSLLLAWHFAFRIEERRMVYIAIRKIALRLLGLGIHG